MADETNETDAQALSEDLATGGVVTEPSGPSLVARLGAELVGTFTLVLLGVGTALLLQVTNNGTVVVGLGFGLGAMIAIIAFGGISGAHLNPAVTVGAWLAGRVGGDVVAPYVLAQVVGGALAGLVLRAGIGSLDTVGGEQAQGLMGSVSIGFGDHAPFAASGLNWGVVVALAVELVATALLMLVVLSSTSKKAPAAMAPFSIGLALAALVTWTIPFTNAALNPARATATAIFADDWALGQLWAWWLAPVVGAAIVGLAFRALGPEEDLERTPAA